MMMVALHHLVKKAKNNMVTTILLHHLGKNATTPSMYQQCYQTKVMIFSMDGHRIRLKFILLP